MKKFLSCLLITSGVTIGAIPLLFAVQQKQARVTQKVNDVRLLAPHIQPRPASVNDNIHEGTSVRTGSESRAELTFLDQTIARVGANTVFNLGNEGRTYDVGSGAILMYAPENVGAVKVKTPVASAAVTGFTGMFSAARYTKFIMLEGNADIWLNKHPGQHKSMHSGQFISIPKGATVLPPVFDLDVCKTINTALFIKGFSSRLPSWNQILGVCESQRSSPPTGGLVDPSAVDKILSAENARPPEHSPPPLPSPTGDGELRPRKP
jgi:hypothetical protein